MSDFGLLGVGDDRLICDISHPSLSSIDIDGERMGYEAGIVLRQLLDGKPSGGDVLIPPLRIEGRDSTFESRRMDGDLAKTVRYIKENIGMQMDVRAVAEHVGTGRRTLERKFDEFFGITPATMIGRCRIHKAQLLLEGSELTVQEIATRIGLSHDKYFSTLFKLQTGLTPFEYRKRARFIGR
jgi:LacI family transcriptional regulator